MHTFRRYATLTTKITLYRADIFLSWGRKILRIVESLMMVLFSAYLSSLIPPSYGGLTIAL